MDVYRIIVRLVVLSGDVFQVEIINPNTNPTIKELAVAQNEELKEGYWGFFVCDENKEEYHYDLTLSQYLSMKDCMIEY